MLPYQTRTSYDVLNLLTFPLYGQLKDDDVYKNFSNPSNPLIKEFIVSNTFLASPAWDTPANCWISHWISNRPSSVIVWYPSCVNNPPSNAPYGGINVGDIKPSYFSL